MTTTFQLIDATLLKKKDGTAWVAGWINGGPGAVLQVLDGSGNFSGSQPTTVPFHAVADVPTVLLTGATNGDDRLLFVVSKDKPKDLTVIKTVTPADPTTGTPEVTILAPQQYTQYPYANNPGVAAPGPFDVFEFGMNAQDNLTAVSGFGLNLRFEVTYGGGAQQYGVQSLFNRKMVGEAFQKFVTNEAVTLPSATAFGELLYNGPIAVMGAPSPPKVDGQYFAISDPNDMLASLPSNYTQSTNDPLTTFWNDTLTAFFKAGQYLSINLSSNAPDP